MTAAADSAATRPARRRWLWIALLVSVAVNALLVGVIARSLWQLRGGAALGGALEGNLASFVSSLPPERRNALRQDALGERPQLALRPLRMELRMARMEAMRIFLAEPFDKKAFTAAQERMLDAEVKLRRAVQRFLPELGERMTPQERRALARATGRPREFGPAGAGPSGLVGPGPGRGFGGRRGGNSSGDIGDEPAPPGPPGVRRP